MSCKTSTGEHNTQLTDFLRKENELLKALLKEKDEKYSNLLQTKLLLEEKVKLRYDNNKSNAISNKNNEEQKRATKMSQDKNQSMAKVTKNVTEPLQTNLSDHENINQSTTQDINTSTNDMPDEETFSFQNRKQKRHNERQQRRKMIGKSDESNQFGFKGTQPKVWLYLYRVLPGIEGKQIASYIQSKIGQEEVEVEELPSNMPNKKCFMVGAGFSFKEQMYNPSFWPKGIGFKRFNFQKYRMYQQNSRPQNF
jgi:hypothetical protein